MKKKSDVMTLKPGLLVSLKTSMRGGVEYARVDAADKKDGAALVEEWKTIKRVADAKEHERASKLRSKLAGLVRKVCAPSAFGLICPASKESELTEAIAEAKAGAAAFNTEAKTVQIAIYVLKGRIAETDDEAAAAIQSELKDLLAEMQRAIEGGAVSDAREAASKLLKMGMVLDENTQGKVKRAVDEVRETAKAIVKKATEGGVTTAQAVWGVKFKAVEEARFALLDDGEVLTPVSTLPATDARSFDNEEFELPEPREKVSLEEVSNDPFDPSSPEANLKADSSSDARSFDV